MLQKLLRRFHRNERGTALTEFVITLPIFVMIFSFMASFHRQTVELNRIRYRAATSMWEANMAVQNAGTSAGDHGIPFLAAADANSIISGSPSEAGDPPQQVIVGGLLTGKSGMEMRAGATVVGAPASDPASATSLTFASSMAADGLTPLPTAQSSPVAIFNFAIVRSLGVTRHAGIIGTRYGAVEGKHSGTIDSWPWGAARGFDAQYDVLVSPISIPSGDEMFVVGASRLLADQDPCLNTVLEISTSSSDC